MQPQYLSKSLVAASSNGIGSISTAGVVTLNSSFVIDTGRRILFSSTASSTGLTFNITGKGEQRNAPFTETVLGNSGGSVNTTSDFLTVSSITVSSAPNTTVLVGTSSIGGTPWKQANYQINPMTIAAAVTFSSSANGMTATVDFMFDDIWGTNLNPNLPNVPTVFNSSGIVGVSTNTYSAINIDGPFGIYNPISGYRLTITSSSSSAGTVYATVIQSGIGV